MKKESTHIWSSLHQLESTRLANNWQRQQCKHIVAHDCHVFERRRSASGNVQCLISSPTLNNEWRWWNYCLKRAHSLYNSELIRCFRVWRKTAVIEVGDIVVLFNNNALLKVTTLRRCCCSLTKTSRSALFTTTSHFLVNKTEEMSLLTNAFSRGYIVVTCFKIIGAGEYMSLKWSVIWG